MKIKPNKTPNFTIYKAKDGWRWRLTAKNGKTICEGGEAYRVMPKTADITAMVAGALAAARWVVETGVKL